MELPREPSAVTSSAGIRSGGIRQYRPSRGEANVVDLMTLFFLTIGVLSVRSAVLNEDGSYATPLAAAIAYGVFWGGFGLLTGFASLSLRRTRYTTAGSSIHRAGIGRPEVVLLPEVTRAEWHNRGRAVVLHSPTGRMLIGFGGLQNGLELRDWVLNALPAGVQSGEGPAQPARSRPPAPAMVIDGPKLLVLSLANVGVMALACVPWEPPRVAAMAVMLAGMICPAVAALALLDVVRRPTRSTIAAAVLGLAVLVALAVKGWGLFQAMSHGLV